MAVVRALFGLFLLSLVSGQIVDITPREAVRRIGDDLTVLCKVPYPIDSCRVTVGTVSYRLLPSIPDGDVVYSGEGLQHGQCGAHIKHIKEEWNGNISCVLPPQAGNIEVLGTMRLLVARAPGDPHLATSPFGTFQEGETLKARCDVPNGRPAARITWFLDQEPLLQGVHQPIITTEPGTDLQTVSQNVTRTLTADDNGRKLTCRAEHEALDQPKEVWQQLAVHYPPKRLESGPITIFGLKLGSEGRLNVTIRAHPVPDVEWTVGDVRLRPSQANEDRSVMALEPIALEGGYYNITLVLARITKQDVERTYYVTVKNAVGEEQMTVRISTMMEPAGVELDTGSIVGIVLGVLILLIAVSLAVFAKATDRWCFAGHGRDHTKNSGESTPAGDVLIESGIPLAARTDTESAVGGREGRAARSRLADLGARMRAVLPRAKDKVATETQAENEDKPLSDEKKGVVYAELALGDQTSTEKPPPPSTEYAEIVYSDQTQQKEVKEDHK